MVSSFHDHMRHWFDFQKSDLHVKRWFKAAWGEGAAATASYQQELLKGCTALPVSAPCGHTLIMGHERVAEVQREEEHLIRASSERSLAQSLGRRCGHKYGLDASEQEQQQPPGGETFTRLRIAHPPPSLLSPGGTRLTILSLKNFDLLHPAESFASAVVSSTNWELADPTEVALRRGGCCFVSENGASPAP